MTGFKIIRIGTLTTQIVCPAGMIDWTPNLKYRVEKRNAFDPTYLHRREPFHEDAFKLSIPASPDEYHALLSMLNQDGAYYLLFDSAGSTMQFPVEVDKLPPCQDDLHEYPLITSLSLVSRYLNYTPPTTPNAQAITEFDESLTIEGS